jgi:hypothetical protein
MGTQTQAFPRLKQIESELADMPIGHCAVKWDCLIWRVREDSFAVGACGGISIKQPTIGLTCAARSIFYQRCPEGMKP